MASAAELYPSREGSTFGVNGGQGHVQAWKVTVDDVGQNPANYLATYHVPIGTVFPWSEFGQVAMNYMIGKRLQVLTWVVWVYYGTPLSIPGAPWRVMVRGALQSEDSVYDAENKPIKFPLYISQAKYNALTTEDRVEYEIARDASGTILADFYTTLVGGKTTLLFQLTGSLLKPVQMDLPVSQLSLIGTTPFLADTARPYANSVLGRVNETVFYNGAPRTIKFDSFEVDSRPGFDPSLSPTGVLYDVSLNFVENVHGWDKILRHEYYDDKTGESTPIAAGDALSPLEMGEPTVSVPPQITLVKRNLTTDFFDLLGQFGIS